MPTQIPVEPDRSWTVAARATLMLSLLAVAIMYEIVFIVVWAYR